VRYPDLPDGRPQYGIRLPQNGPDAQAAPQQPDGQRLHGQHLAGPADGGQPADQRPVDEQRPLDDQQPVDEQRPSGDQRQ